MRRDVNLINIFLTKELPKGICQLCRGSVSDKLRHVLPRCYCDSDPKDPKDREEAEDTVPEKVNMNYVWSHAASCKCALHKE